MTLSLTSLPKFKSTNKKRAASGGGLRHEGVCVFGNNVVGTFFHLSEHPTTKQRRYQANYLRENKP